MVKHIIIWKLLEEHNNDKIKSGIKQSLEALQGNIEGLLEITVETEGLKSSNSDVMLYSVFESEEALKKYATHPKHVYVADNFVRPYVKERSCFDFLTVDR